MVVFSNSTTAIFFPASGWTSTQDFDFLRDSLETRNMMAGNVMSIQITYQTCNTPDSPDAAVALASVRTSDGLTWPVAYTDESATTNAKQFIRGGYLVKNASDSTVRQAWACGMIESQKK
jgi:hypothetical protein